MRPDIAGSRNRRLFEVGQPLVWRAAFAARIRGLGEQMSPARTVLAFAIATGILASVATVPVRGRQSQQPASAGTATPIWEVKASGIDTNLRGVSVVAPVRGGANAPLVIWASGSNGVILKSTDSGKTFQQIHIPDADQLDFRGIRAFGSASAYVMSSGEGDKSRIYKTTDGGATWKMQFTDTRPSFFLDAIVCDGELKCAALSDPVDGKFLIVRTTDGETWQIAPGDGMPAALKDEGAFAASNSSMFLEHGPKGSTRLTFATGGPGGARVFSSPDFGKSWTVTETPLGGSASSGIFSIAHISTGGNVIVGGDYKKPDATEKTAALCAAPCTSYELAATPPSGYRSSVISLAGKSLIAVGPNGSDVSDDGGDTWRRADATNLNALDVVSISKRREVWAVGPGGTVARLVQSATPTARPRRE
jgi:photosystem II stability/assembly factor-like uncharacterized protein